VISKGNFCEAAADSVIRTGWEDSPDGRLLYAGIGGVSGFLTAAQREEHVHLNVGAGWMRSHTTWISTRFRYADGCCSSPGVPFVAEVGARAQILTAHEAASEPHAMAVEGVAVHERVPGTDIQAVRPCGLIYKEQLRCQLA
jgi:hypothetical protein